MIKSCEECEVPCCQTGPGPHQNVAPEDYLENFGDHASYNTKCIALTAEGACNLWGTSDLPMACRVYVCQSKSYTKLELEQIDEVFERECPNCGSEWLRGRFEGKNYIDICEMCGYEASWNKETISKGKRKRKITR